MKKIALLLFFILSIQFIFGVDGDSAIEVRTDKANVKVYLNDSLIGTTSTFGNINIKRIENLKAGSYKIKCVYAEFDPLIKHVSVGANEVKVVEVNFSQKGIKVEGLTDSEQGQQVKQTGIVIVKSKPTGATVVLNGNQATADCKFSDVAVGVCNVKISFPGRESLVTSFQLAKGNTVTVIADFFNNTIETDVKYTVTFSSTPIAKIYLDGKLLGDSPVTKEIPGGEHDLNIFKDEYTFLEEKIDIQSNNFYEYELQTLGKLKFGNFSNNVEVFVNNKRHDHNLKESFISSGNADISITILDSISFEFTVPIEPRKLTSVDVNLESVTVNFNNTLKLIPKTQNWENYYNKEKEIKPHQVGKKCLDRNTPLLLWGLNLTTGLPIIFDLIYAPITCFKVPAGWIGVGKGSIAEKKNKTYFCGHLMIFDKEAFYKPVYGLTDEDKEHNANLRKDAFIKQREDEENIKKKLDGIKNLIKYNIDGGSSKIVSNFKIL